MGVCLGAKYGEGGGGGEYGVLASPRPKSAPNRILFIFIGGSRILVRESEGWGYTKSGCGSQMYYTDPDH